MSVGIAGADDTGLPNGTNGTSTSEARVVIHVEDENDHAPRFLRSDYQASVSEAVPANTQVLTLQAEDADEGENAKIR